MIEYSLWLSSLALSLALIALTIYSQIAGNKTLTFILYIVTGTSLLLTGFFCLNGLLLESGFSQDANTTSFLQQNTTKYDINGTLEEWWITSAPNQTTTTSATTYREIQNNWTLYSGLLLIFTGLGFSLLGIVFFLRNRPGPL